VNRGDLGRKGLIGAEDSAASSAMDRHLVTVERSP